MRSNNYIRENPETRLQRVAPELAVLRQNALERKEANIQAQQKIISTRTSYNLTNKPTAKPLAMPLAKPLAMPLATPMVTPLAKSAANIRNFSFLNITANKETPGGLVCTSLRNGLANRIFQVLAALGYAEKYSKQCVISKANIQNGSKPHERKLDEMLSRVFPDLEVIDIIEKPRLITEAKEFNYDVLPNSVTNVILQGHFQDDHYFPSNNLIPKIKTCHYPNTYFIHIRAGDYLQKGSFGYDLSYYYKSCFEILSPDTKYVVFSDDVGYATNYMKQFSISYTISNKINQLDAMIEMSNCEGGICANSSFSWLGAFFQDKTKGKRFMPSQWIKGRDCSGVYPIWATIVNSELIVNDTDTSGSVSISLSGGLGNRIFQIFAGLAYARKHNKKFVLCKSIYEIPKIAHEENTDSMIDFIFPNIEYVSSFSSYSRAKETIHMNYNTLPYYKGNVLLVGYFQVEQYSLELENIPNIRTAYYENTYFIHLRLGDYIGFYGMDFDLSKYHKRCFDILGPHAKYIVFSNDNVNAKKYIDKFNIQYTISDKTDALECLIDMANCAGGICANSTFSWMGAFFQRQPRTNIFVPDKWVPNRVVKGIFPSWATRIQI